jgi:hypothetical protein
MKKLVFVLIIIALLVALVPTVASAHTADVPYYTKLIAGQTNWAGWVLVWNDAENLYVKFLGWEVNCLGETHVHVATSLDGIPQRNGNPTPGQFDYGMDHGCTTRMYTHVIPLGDTGVGTELIIAAHAVVNGPGLYDETAWGVYCGHVDQYSFPGKKWATYIEYTIQ